MSFSKGEIDRLGERLREPGGPARPDLLMLQEVTALYGDPLREVERVIQAAGYRSTSRHPKTAGTLVDKLRREQTTRLSQVQDIAGARVVVDGHRGDQDEAVAAIGEGLEGLADCVVPEPVDRREHHSFGYRAVHLTPRVDGYRVEIQVRTVLQDRWANLMEKWADLVGRQVRYGGEPDNADVPFLPGLPDLTPRSQTEALRDVAETIATFEMTDALIQSRAPELQLTVLGHQQEQVDLLLRAFEERVRLIEEFRR